MFRMSLRSTTTRLSYRNLTLTAALACLLTTRASAQAPEAQRAAPPPPPSAAESIAPPAPAVDAESQPAAPEPASRVLATAPQPAPLAEPSIELEPESTTEGQGPPQPAAGSMPEWMRHIKIGGGGILWYHQSLTDSKNNDLSFYNIRLDLDVNVGDFGFHAEPRVRDTKLRPYYDGPAWIEEAYGSWNLGPLALIKLGKVYSRLGLFWDNSFYGNVQVYDGLKLAPDYGASVEGTLGDRIGINYWAQFFLIDGTTNISLQGRDTLSIPGGHRKNEVVINVEPFYKFGKDGLARVGLSLEHLNADYDDQRNGVLRLAAHTKVTVGGFGFWGEYLHQQGKHVPDFPYAGVAATDTVAAIAGRSSGNNHYFEIGAEYTYSRFTLRYNISYANYVDVHVTEWLNVPAVSFKVAEPLSLSAELVFWRHDAREGNSNIDKSLNMLMIANY